MGTNHLADITTKNPIPDQRFQIVRNFTLVLNGQVTDAASGIDGVIITDTACWASIDTAGAGTAEILCEWLING